MYALQIKGKIRIGTRENAAPFAARDASGARSGFEVDLGRELARAIFGARPDADAVIEWVSLDPASATVALTDGRVDVVIGGLDATEERAAALELTEPYLVTGERILITTANEEIKELPDLDTKTVCTQAGSGVAPHVEEANAFARTLELDTYDSCLGALRAGQVDAIGAPETTLWQLRARDPATKLVGRNLMTERYAIGSKRTEGGDRTGFGAFLATWLAAAIRDGTWARLYDRHVKPLSGESRTAP